MTQQSVHVGSLCTVYGGKNLEFVYHAVSRAEVDRNMVGQRTVSVVRDFGQCSENEKLQYIWIAEFDQICIYNQEPITIELHAVQLRKN